MNDLVSIERIQPTRPSRKVAVDSAKYALYQQARARSRDARGTGQGARDALRLHLELFYDADPLVLDTGVPREVLHPLLRGMR